MPPEVEPRVLPYTAGEIITYEGSVAIVLFCDETTTKLFKFYEHSPNSVFSTPALVAMVEAHKKAKEK